MGWLVAAICPSLHGPAGPHRSGPSVQQFSGVQDLENKKARRHRCRGLESLETKRPAVWHASSLNLFQVALSCHKFFIVSNFI